MLVAALLPLSGGCASTWPERTDAGGACALLAAIADQSPFERNAFHIEEGPDESIVDEPAALLFHHLTPGDAKDLQSGYPLKGRVLPAPRCPGFARRAAAALEYMTAPIFSASGELAIVSEGDLGPIGTGESCVWRKEPTGSWSKVTCGATWII